MTTNEGTAWAQLSDGWRYDYTTGTIHGDLTVVGLAWSLAGTVRYNAWTNLYWSVASHACLVAEILAANADNPPSVILGGLHHDDHEAMTGDILRPMIEALSDQCQEEVKRLQGKAQRAIMKKIGIHWLEADDSSWGARIRAADLAALEAERRLLFTVRMPWQTERYVDARMLADGERIILGDFGKIAMGPAAADRYVSRHEALMKLAVRS